MINRWMKVHLDRVVKILVTVIETNFGSVRKDMDKMAGEIDKLATDVADEKVAIDKVVGAVGALVAIISNPSADTVELVRVNALAAQLQAQVEAQTAELNDLLKTIPPAV